MRCSYPLRRRNAAKWKRRSGRLRSLMNRTRQELTGTVKYFPKSLLDNPLAFITMMSKNLGGSAMNDRARTMNSLNALFNEAFFGFYFFTRPIVHGGALRV